MGKKQGRWTMMDFLLEVVVSLLSLLFGLICWMVKRTQTRVDNLEDALIEHRVEAARLYIPRQEYDEKNEVLKKDLREMVHSINESIRNIENYIRENKK